MVLRLLGGEDPVSPSLPPTPPLSPEEDEKSVAKVFETRCAPELSDPANDWALEREIELARLEKENAELRMLLEASAQADSASSSATLPLQLPRTARRFVSQRSRMRTHRAFTSEDIHGHGGHYPSHNDHHELVDMSDEVL